MQHFLVLRQTECGDHVSHEVDLDNGIHVRYRVNIESNRKHYSTFSLGGSCAMPMLTGFQNISSGGERLNAIRKAVVCSGMLCHFHDSSRGVTLHEEQKCYAMRKDRTFFSRKVANIALMGLGMTLSFISEQNMIKHDIDAATCECLHRTCLVPFRTP